MKLWASNIDKCDEYSKKGLCDRKLCAIIAPTHADAIIAPRGHHWCGDGLGASLLRCLLLLHSIIYCLLHVPRCTAAQLRLRPDRAVLQLSDECPCECPRLSLQLVRGRDPWELHERHGRQNDEPVRSCTHTVLRVLSVAAAAYRLLASFPLGSFLPLALKPCSHCGA
jgi:hypothetical protein